MKTLDAHARARHHAGMRTLRTPLHRSRRLTGLSVAALLALAPLLAIAGPGTTVAWENLQGAATSPEAALRDAAGATLLSAGTAAAGDGAVIALGYFTGATGGAVFSGDWVPLTGPQSAHIPYQRTSVGDTADGGGLPDGFFTLQHVFDPDDSALFQRIPPQDTRLAVAIYNGPTIAGSTRFNIATHDDWRWRDPDPILPTFVFINLATSGTLWLGGAESALRTTVPTAAFPGGAARAPARLTNISTRGFVGTGDAQLIPGFVLGGTGSSRLLLRAVGPTLGLPPDEGGFGVSGTLADPLLRVVRRSDDATLATNDDWHAQADAAAVADAIAITGAFPLPAGSRDAALLLDLPVSPGGYTVNITGRDDTTGVVIAEAYLVDPAPDAPAPLVNVSTRGIVGTGDSIMIPGFVLAEGGPRRLLIRAVGPTLAQAPFHLSGTLADPRLRVVPSAAPDTVLAENDDWSADGQASALAAAAAQVGAFALQPGSKDAALVLDLPASDAPRGFTVQVSGASDTTGLVITEIYELP